MEWLVIPVVIFGVLYMIGSIFNKSGHKDYRFGDFTNVLYGLFVVLIASSILFVVRKLFY
jgi:hypothetical protein